MRPGFGFLNLYSWAHSNNLNSHVSFAKAWRKSWSDAVRHPNSGTRLFNKSQNPQASILATYLLGAQCTLSLSLALDATPGATCPVSGTFLGSYFWNPLFHPESQVQFQNVQI